MSNIHTLNKFVKDEFPKDMNIFHLKNYIAESIFEYSENYSQSTNSILTSLPIKLVKEWNDRIKYKNKLSIGMVIYWGNINNLKFTKYDDSRIIYEYNNNNYLIDINKPIRRVRINYGEDFYLNYFTRETLKKTLQIINEKFLLLFYSGTLDDLSFESLDILRQYAIKLALKNNVLCV